MSRSTSDGMEALELIRPRGHERVIDLVEEAGHDVSDWGNFKGGPAKASMNPRYCYQWAFTQRDKPVILSIWFEQMQVVGERVFQDLNVRQEGLAAPSPVRRTRSGRFDDALQLAWREKLPLRVIVCEGDMRDITVEQESSSSVQKRLLDPIPWALTAYDWQTGRALIERAAAPRFIDQHDLAALESEVRVREVSGRAFSRSAEVRQRVLSRANGKCEFCGTPGFQTPHGVYLETHHIQPLAQGGSDSTQNVIALCANHHREAHHGKHRADLAATFSDLVRAG
jgi:5-methylcytosine-specific restriction protein A